MTFSFCEILLNLTDSVKHGVRPEGRNHWGHHHPLFASLIRPATYQAQQHLHPFVVVPVEKVHFFFYYLTLPLRIFITQCFNPCVWCLHLQSTRVWQTSKLLVIKKEHQWRTRKRVSTIFLEIAFFVREVIFLAQ